MTIKRILILLCASFVTMFFSDGTIVSSASRNKPLPTAPTNLTASGITETTMVLSWGASTARAGIASYKIRLINNRNSQYNTVITVSGSQTTYTARFLPPDSPYSITVYAVDPRGNRSPDSNTINVTTAADETPPTTPTLSALVLSPSQVQLTWSRSVDNLPINCCLFSVFNNGVRVTQHINWMGETATSVSAIVRRLSPGTQYTFRVDVSDFYQNTASSNPVTVTTETSTDTVPPLPPTNLHLISDNGAFELWLGWTQTTDDVDPQPFIEYEIYVNGVLSPLGVSSGISTDFVYAHQQCENRFVVRAVDRSGNVSEPSNTLLVNLWNCS